MAIPPLRGYPLQAIHGIDNAAPAGLATGNTAFFPTPAGYLSISGSAVQPTAGNLMLRRSGGKVLPLIWVFDLT